ncbi:hypothetical protein DEU56DRAFT_759433 [Suillus clintonianus]|uniref:uncharacterized protein n=1 Tax=Suillus clintonianus TaxID=1904413 RepID=UPI001B876488|nr:uncharacterized protein DEU56DRAFT_759433 [Suillus clintonianus]KAG2125098.1 hypothetical protein DEU56DRAFT_759433 [Suillus clintonianus]
MATPSSPSSAITAPPDYHETAVTFAKLATEAMTCHFALLHYDSTSKSMIEWCWPDDDKGQKVPLSDFEKYRDEQAAVYPWRDKDTNKTQWNARCARDICGYRVKIDKYYDRSSLVTFNYPLRDCPEEHDKPCSIQLEWAWREQKELMAKLDSSIGDGITREEFRILFRRCKRCKRVGIRQTMNRHILACSEGVQKRHPKRESLSMKRYRLPMFKRLDCVKDITTLLSIRHSQTPLIQRYARFKDGQREVWGMDTAQLEGWPYWREIKHGASSIPQQVTGTHYISSRQFHAWYDTISVPAECILTIAELCDDLRHSPKGRGKDTIWLALSSSFGDSRASMQRKRKTGKSCSVKASTMHISPTTGRTSVPLSVLQEAHWDQSSLRCQITARHNTNTSSSSPSSSPPPLREKELGLSITTAEILARLPALNSPPSADEAFFYRGQLHMMDRTSYIAGLSSELFVVVLVVRAIRILFVLCHSSIVTGLNAVRARPDCQANLLNTGFPNKTDNQLFED